VTDYVSVRDLRVLAVIGVRDWEREIEQTLVFSADMAADVGGAAASDELSDTLDYSAVAETITTVVREGRFRLIETAAERVAERLLADYGLNWLRLEVRKPVANASYTAAVTIERTRDAPGKPDEHGPALPPEGTDARARRESGSRPRSR
jgi:7,8-dihydroneopterin aldolase/epimerase/oxygenase